MKSAACSGQGVDVTRDNLRIAENATLILPLHRELDALREAAAGDGKIGTTKRGIGPAYEDKVGRRAIRVMDLQNLKTLHAKIERLLTHHNALRRGLERARNLERRAAWPAGRNRAQDPAVHGYGVVSAGSAAPGRQTHSV